MCRGDSGQSLSSASGSELRFGESPHHGVSILLKRENTFTDRYSLENYMQNPRAVNHDDTPGALDLGQATATRIYCAFFIGYYVAPLGFSVLSDSYLGRYKTLILSLALVYGSRIK